MEIIFQKILSNTNLQNAFNFLKKKYNLFLFLQNDKQNKPRPVLMNSAILRQIEEIKIKYFQFQDRIACPPFLNCNKKKNEQTHFKEMKTIIIFKMKTIIIFKIDNKKCF